MSSGQNEAAAKVLETQRRQESGSENEETDSITDQSSSKSSTVHAQKSAKSAATTKSLLNPGTATQFSVQRSDDADGLRMKISAIRPPTTPTTPQTKASSKAAKSNSKSLKQNSKATEKSLVHNQSRRKMLARLPPVAGGQFSDATESGCSEATTKTTNTAANATKKIKVKRKKIPQKNHSSNNNNNNSSEKAAGASSKSVKKARLQADFSSDSEDDLPLKIHQQRAPRLLLTAIGHGSSSTLQGTPAHGSDNIGLSSSDTELPDLVKAAIKRVESDTEDTTVEGSFRKAAKAKHLPQYQSTLLQDFMEKTQMLGQSVKPNIAAAAVSSFTASPALHSSQSDKVPALTAAVASATSSQPASRKRRGRPKKAAAGNAASSSVLPGGASSLAINESADSGVISTTSTTQSTTPSPKMPTASAASVSALPSHEHQCQPASGSAATQKPKIDMAYLDKRMYATERVLYPPPRSKRRQSSAKKSQKEDQQLDPVWREIDVNKKFRLRSVSGYKSDGGGGASGGRAGLERRGTGTTICSKILAAKSGYVSDYGSVRHHQRSQHSHNSGYKSDASCKSRYSTKSCMSRRSRAKSCGYRSDYKDSSTAGGPKQSCSKMRRRRRASMLLKPEANGKATDPTDEQDILQLAGLSLGQSSEESNEYISKPSLQNLPTTSASKKYGEINRYVTTGQYFGRGGAAASVASATPTPTPTPTPDAFISKMLLQRKHAIGVPEAAGSVTLPKSLACKIKSRRSSAASLCSSYVSGTSRMRSRRHRRKSLCMSRSSVKALNIDSKLLTEIEIITSTFNSRCRIQDDRLTASSGKEKLLAEANKLQQATLAAPPPTVSAPPLLASGGTLSAAAAAGGSTPVNSGGKPLKRALKKRKLSEPLVDFAMLSASAAAGGNLTGGPNGSGSGSGSSSKRRHKKSSTSSSPDDHKLPLKKRHYLLTPGERPPADVAAAFASANGKLNAEAWAAAAAAAKSTASTKSQAQFNARAASGGAASGKSGLTPKKRHLLQTATSQDDSNSSSSPLRIVVDNNSISGGKLLDISPSSLCSLKQQRRQRSEASGKQRTSALAVTTSQQLQLDSPSGGSYPPPGIFEPSVELEIQIPLSKLNEAAVGIITKAEVDSPLLTLDIKEDTKKEGSMSTRVVESLLHKTGGNLLLRRKRKKINRTGFPTVRRKKRKVSDASVLPSPQLPQKEQPPQAPTVEPRETRSSSGLAGNLADCERVPASGEAKDNFVARSNQRAPRLSVVALERLQGSPKPNPRPATPAVAAAKGKPKAVVETKTKGRGRGRPQAVVAPPVQPPPPEPAPEPTPAVVDTPTVKKRGRTKTIVAEIEKPGKVVKPKLEPNIKLPAGVDPNTNFSCKIRLKRRKNMGTPDQPVILQADIDAEAEAKYTGLPPPDEHEPLPMTEALPQSSDYASCSDTSDDKSSSASGRKMPRLKKNYLVAGLFSNYYKQAQQMPPPKAAATKKSQEDTPPTSKGSGTKKLSLLPPPPYCERYFRRTQMDFELPFDIWWAYKNDKLPQKHVVPSWNYRKIRTNVYADSVRPNVAGFDHPTCNCKPPEAACTDNCLNRMVYTECSPSNCPAGDKCRNQKIQRHEIAPGVERFMTTDKGWGVRTKLPIVKGTYILEYVGEVVTEREFKQRMGTIYLNDTHHYCLHLDGGLVIDGQRMGSDCRFVNHSCEPNCEMQKWSVNGLSRMVLFAKRAIEQGEELTYDYNFSLFNPSEGQPCRCNTPQCRGVIGGKSQRVKPLPAAEGAAKPPSAGDGRKDGRQRKHKARKHAQRQTANSTKVGVTVAAAKVQQLSEKERKLVKQFNVFLMRNYEKIRRCKAKRAAKLQQAQPAVATTPAEVPGRRPSTPTSPSLAAQISAACSPRNIKTRGLTQAVQDPEVEKMVKMAVVLREICNALEPLLVPELLTSVASKKKKAMKGGNGSSGKAGSTASNRVEFKTIQAHVEQGHYKTSQEFDDQMQLLFTETRQMQTDDESSKSKEALQALVESYEQQKQANYAQLLEILGDADLLVSFKPKDKEPSPKAETSEKKEVATEASKKKEAPIVIHPGLPPGVNASEEDVIQCICGLYKDEGLMIQCAKCMVWQHTECTKADVNAENYQCERCDPRKVDREIPLDDYTEEGHRYYLSLMRGELQVRQGDAVYVLRDIPIKDEAGNVLSTSKKHTYETIGAIDYQECDIFRVEHLWKNEEGKRFIFGHHFLRPHETFHEPSRRFYPNEVVRVSLYEVVPIELVIGRCWVLDRTTFCKGRPVECTDEDHCYICELRVDKTARFFSKAKANYPACTKSYAFRKFPEKLKISKSYAPHDVDPSMLKTKKQKTDLEVAAGGSSITASRTEPNKVATIGSGRGRQRSLAGASSPTPAFHVIKPVVPNVQVVKKKKMRLENVLITMKLNCLDAQTAQEQPIDLTYLLSGRGARQRKTHNNNNNNSNSSGSQNNHSTAPSA